MLFLAFSNADIQFTKKELTWKTYTIKEALPTTRQVQLINWKKFAKVALDENIKTFVVHDRSLESKKTIYLARKAQIGLVLAKEVTILAKYSDFANVFLEKLANILPEQIGVNEHAIKLEKGKQPPYGPIYNLKPVELKTFKIYIKTNLANHFIQYSKLATSALIPFVRKTDGSFYLSVNYQRLNNLIIKN